MGVQPKLPAPDYTALVRQDRLRPSQANLDARVVQSVENFPDKLAIFALWRVGLEHARDAVSHFQGEFKLVFAQLASKPALQGSKVRELARLRIAVVYVPNSFASSEDNDPDLHLFVLNALRDREMMKIQDARTCPIQVDNLAAAAMRDRVRTQQTPAPSVIGQLTREFYEANEFFLPGRC